MLVAGEASGDLHAAKLVAALREALDGECCEFFGAAGPRMRDAGVGSIIDSDELSIVGLPEIARALPIFLRAFRLLRSAAKERRPDVAVLVDFPDFNLRLARSLHKSGIPVVYYISPQLWAWRSYRIRTIRKYVDLVISILPFETQWYADRGVRHVEYVGSPLSREVHASRSKEAFCESHGLDPQRPIVALLPGSRRKEIAKILPVMLRAASMISANDDRIQFVIAAASERHLTDIAGAAGGETARTVTVVDETFDAVNAADAAAVASGTATLETGILGTPMAIVYKTSTLNYRLLRPLIDVEHFGLINLIAGERVAAELIQDDLTPETLAAELRRLLDGEVNSSVRKRLKLAADKLGHGGASMRAAGAIVKLLKGS